MQVNDIELKEKQWKSPSASRRWAFLALFQAVLQEFIEVLVQFLLCRGQFLFSLFCPGFVIG